MSTEQRLNQLEARVNNIVRVGTVTALTEKGMVRVSFGERSNLVSYELPLLVRQTLKNKDSYMPDIGEHVTCLFLPNGVEQGFVLGAINSESSPPSNTNPNVRGTEFSDGTTVYYDREANHLHVTVAGAGLVTVECKEATVKAETKATIDSPETEITGHATIKNGLAIEGGTVTHDGVNISKTHTHTGSPTAAPGPQSPTGAPI